MEDGTFIRRRGRRTLTGVWLSWLGIILAKQKVTGLITGQGMCLGCGFSPHSVCIREATNQCFFHTSMFVSLSFSLPGPSLKIS